MSILKFSDGVNINTSGDARTLELKDGWYAVGNGILIPCRDEEEAKKQKKIIARKNEKRIEI